MITSFESETQQHQLQLHPDQPESPPSSAPTGPPIAVDLSKANVRLVRPRVPDVADVSTAATTIETSPPTMARSITRTVAQTSVHTDTAHTAKARRITRTDAARTDAQTPVHTGIAHTANINTLIERSAPTPPKGKRQLE